MNGKGGAGANSLFFGGLGGLAGTNLNSLQFGGMNGLGGLGNSGGGQGPNSHMNAFDSCS